MVEHLEIAVGQPPTLKDAADTRYEEVVIKNTPGSDHRTDAEVEVVAAV